jgi:hypothetical protein
MSDLTKLWKKQNKLSPEVITTPDRKKDDAQCSTELERRDPVSKEMINDEPTLTSTMS